MAMQELASMGPHLADLVAAGLYVMGMAMGIGAAIAFKNHNEDPANFPLSGALAKALVAGLMITLPIFLTVGSDNLFGPQTAISTPQPATASIASGEPSPAAPISAKAPVKVLAPKAVPAPTPDFESVAAKPATSEPKADVAIKADKPVDSDLRALFEVLIGFGLVGLGGWALILRAARKSKNNQEAKIDSAIAMSTDLARKSESESNVLDREFGK